MGPQVTARVQEAGDQGHRQNCSNQPGSPLEGGRAEPSKGTLVDGERADHARAQSSGRLLDAKRLVHLASNQLVHQVSASTGMKCGRIAARPRLMRDLTVPTGTPMIAATSASGRSR